MLRRGARHGGMAERNAMMDPTHALSISRQAQLAGLSRGSVSYVPTSVSAADLVLMRHLDALHLAHPFMGARMCVGTPSKNRDATSAWTDAEPGGIMCSWSGCGNR